MMKPLTLLALFFLISPLYADELTLDPPLIQDVIPLPTPPSLPCSNDQVVVDLMNPLYVDGVLFTDCGGVLTAPGLRIQAQEITYRRSDKEGLPVSNVTCSGNLLIDYQDWVLKGETLYYDFITNRGYLTCARTAMPPWYIGGHEFLLMETGEIIVIDGYLTTSEGECKDLQISAPCITLSPCQVITVKDLQMKVMDLPLFWLPTLSLNLRDMGRSPLAFQFGWQGFLGSYVSVLYQFLSWKDFEATARVDGFFAQGVGFGIETAYTPDFRPTRWFSRNYYAHDIPIYGPAKHDRYRFQGTYFDKIQGWTFEGLYDFVSDPEMASDYTTQDFALQTASQTQLSIRRQEKDWLASLFTRVRVNDFQSINQELPSLTMQLHPLEIPFTGIIAESNFKASYLNYVFSEDVTPGNDFSSGRVALHPFFYRPLFLGPIVTTPEAGLIGIAYSRSPNGGGSQGQVVGEFGLKVETALSKCTERWKHVLEPYLHYTYLTEPTFGPDEHYIFSISDGLNQLNQLRFGVQNSFFLKSSEALVRPLWVELWANAFFDAETLQAAIPRAYANLEWMPFPSLLTGMESAWNFQNQELDLFNARLRLTVNADLAFGIEYRHRSRYDWRKADFYNFILDVTRFEEELLASPLSDQRDTLLFQIFARPTPNWSAKVDIRHGWNREYQRPYFEYQLDLSRIIFDHWKATFTYERLEAENRFRFSFLMLPCS